MAGDDRVTTLARDELHRVREITYPATAGYPGWTVTITRDEFGRTTAVQDQNGNSSFVYDDLNRLVSVSPAVGQAVSYQYLKDLPLARAIGRVTLTGVGTWEFREDGKGREAQVLNPFNQLTTRYFDPDSKLLREVRANGTYSDYAYTPRDWLGGIEHRLAGGGLLDTLNYFYTDGNGVYDPTGHLRREVDSLNRTHAFFYSPTYELTAEQHPDFGTIEYFLEPNGNRTAKRWNGAVTEYYGVDAQNKLLWTNQAGNFAPTSGQASPYRLFQYDLAGQPTRKEMRETAGGVLSSDGLDWDGMGKLRRIVDLSTTLERYSATYDGGGIRATSRLAGVDHVFSGGAGLLHDTAGATAYTPGVSQRKNGEDRWLHEDWLGSSRFLTDGTGTNVPTGYRYDAFGAVSATSGPDATSQKFAGRWEYQSDVVGGMQQLGHRLYDPALGRFPSPDPIGLVGGMNLYRYVYNSPIRYVDPSGLTPGAENDTIGMESGYAVGLSIKLLAQYYAKHPNEYFQNLAKAGKFNGKPADPTDCGSFVSFIGQGYYDPMIPTVGVPAIWNYVSADWYHWEVGTITSQADLKPGDLIFGDAYVNGHKGTKVADGKGDSHLGIYSGPGETISASLGTRGPAVRPWSPTYLLYARPKVYPIPSRRLRRP